MAAIKVATLKHCHDTLDGHATWLIVAPDGTVVCDSPDLALARKEARQRFDDYRQTKCRKRNCLYGLD
jgi:hypothetical protein